MIKISKGQFEKSILLSILIIISLTVFIAVVVKPSVLKKSFVEILNKILLEINLFNVTTTTTTIPPQLTTQEVKVWMIQYIPPGGIESLYPLAQVTDPVAFTQNILLPSMNDASKYHGYSNQSAQPALNYVLENSSTENNPPPSRPDNYLGAPSKAPDQPGYLDLPVIFQNYNICQLANDRDIKTVILWTAGSGQYGPKGFESYITGSKGIPTNGPILSGLAYCNNKTILVLGLNYERGLSEALESYGHHLERVFRHFETTGPTRYSSWSDETVFYSGYYPPQRGDSCGTDHNPPNARSEYDRSNTANFQSDCRNWKPDGTGIKETLNCNAWGCTGDEWLKWWMQNMPGLGNTLIDSSGKKIPNWWVYIGDPDNCWDDPFTCHGTI